jgi:hypothetical protein
MYRFVLGMEQKARSVKIQKYVMMILNIINSPRRIQMCQINPVNFYEINLFENQFDIGTLFSRIRNDFILKT